MRSTPRTSTSSKRSARSQAWSTRSAPYRSANRKHCFLGKKNAFAAYDLEKNQTAHELGEEIEVLPVPFELAMEMIRTGEIQDGKTIATLLMFERFFAGR